jgi:hypothetical protein
MLIDSQARTISWGDSAGRAVPSGFEDRLRAWLSLFVPQIQFLPMQELPCARQTDGYSCGVIAVNTLKHHIFGDDLWTSSQREILRIQEFLDILDFSERWRAHVSISDLRINFICSTHRVNSHQCQCQHRQMSCPHWHTLSPSPHRRGPCVILPILCQRRFTHQTLCLHWKMLPPSPPHRRPYVILPRLCQPRPKIYRVSIRDMSLSAWPSLLS